MNTYKPKTKVKAVWKALIDYINKSDKDGVHIPEFEALRPFFGKKGQILKRTTRSKKGQEKLESAIKEAKEKFGAKPSREKINKELEERKEKAAEVKKKAKKTYRDRKKKEAAGKAEKTGGKVNFRSIAQKASRQYDNVVDIMMDASIRKIMDAYGIGSDLIEYLAEQGLTVQQIKDFIYQLTETIDDLPAEALALATMDGVLGTLIDIRETYTDADFDEVAQMFNFALYYPDAMENVKEVINIWQEAGGNENMPFEDFAEAMESCIDPLNADTARDILGIEEEE